MLSLSTVALLEFIGPTAATGVPTFGGPFGVSCTTSDAVLIADDLSHRIVRATERGDLTRAVGEFGSGRGQLQYPDSARLAGDGTLYVADTGGNRIQVWQADDGAFIREFGRYASPGAEDWRRTLLIAGLLLLIAGTLGWALGPGSRIRPWSLTAMAGGGLAALGSIGVMLLSPQILRNPRDLLIRANGEVWVTDFGSDVVRVFDASGRLRISHGAPSEHTGGLRQPVGIAEHAGLIYIADSGNHRVAVFDDNGRVRRTFGSRGSAAGQLDAPQGLAIGDDGRVYVADRGNRRVQIFTAEGEPAGTIEGDLSGPIRTFTPAGLCVMSDGRLLIADTTGHRILQWDPLR